MTLEKLRYNKLQINAAGKILANDKSSNEEKNIALEVLDNWRAIHSYPMHIFQMRLKNKSQKVDENSLTAQRLKRVPAIIYKLRRSYNSRKPSMKLFQMQDVGGCRAILSDVSKARELCEQHYLKGDLKHKRVGFKDYILNPKEDGYRSIHLVYEYKSDKGKKEFNGLRVEIQIRSRLQHIWATAVETAGFFTRQAIKSNEGVQEWLEFFKLMSSAFAKLENCQSVPNTPQDERELYSSIKAKEDKLKVVTKMNSWTNAIQLFSQVNREIKKDVKGKAKFFLLELDILGDKLTIKSYTKKEEQKAINDYSALEKRHSGQKDYDIVLVGADNANDLEKAYTNYFVDTSEFIGYLKKIINQY